LRQLFPTFMAEIEPAHVYGDPPTASGRPGVRLNMIASVDGATTIAGTSGGLGGAGDRLVFRALRSVTDVVLVGAGTVRADRYGPPALPAEVREARTARGQAPLPTIAIVSRTSRLEWGRPLFSEPTTRPIVITVQDAAAADRARAAEVADVIVAGETTVDLAAALHELGARGALTVLAEGGPSLNRDLSAAGLLDELCLTLSPLLLGGSSRHILAGPAASGQPGARPVLGVRGGWLPLPAPASLDVGAATGRCCGTVRPATARRSPATRGPGARK
jgi:riboflavin biosynthesis pyrimidine reductase